MTPGHWALLCFAVAMLLWFWLVRREQRSFCDYKTPAGGCSRPSCRYSRKRGWAGLYFDECARSNTGYVPKKAAEKPDRCTKPYRNTEVDL